MRFLGSQLLEDKWAQRILAPRDAPTVGMCRFLPFLSPVTQTRFTSQPSAGASPGTGGPVLAWRPPCLLLLGPLAEEKSQTLLEPAVPTRSGWLRDSVAGTGTGQGLFCHGLCVQSSGRSPCRAAQRGGTAHAFTGLGGVCGQAWSTQVSGWQPGRCFTSFFPLLEHLESWTEPPSAGQRGGGPARCSVSLAVGARRLCVRRGTHQRAKPHLNCFGFEPRDAQMCRLFQM